MIMIIIYVSINFVKLLMKDSKEITLFNAHNWPLEKIDFKFQSSVASSINLFFKKVSLFVRLNA